MQERWFCIYLPYALKGTTQPIGVAEYEIIKSIPNDLKPQLPTIETLEKELSAIFHKKETE